jgi:hypothetical protein
MQTSLERLKKRIEDKKTELKEMQEQKKQVEQAIKALSA